MNEAHATHGQSADHDISVLDIALVLAANLRLIIVFPIVVGVLALGITFVMPSTYTATARILPPQQQQNSAANLLASQLGGFAGIVGAAAGLKNPVDTYVAMVKSRTVADGLVNRFQLRQVYNARYNHDARKELANRTQIAAGRDGLIVIDVDDHDPKRAADLANGYVLELQDLTQRLAVTEAAQRRLFFENQLKRTKDDLTKAEITLGGSGISEAALKTMPQSALEALARLKAQVTAQEVKLAAMRGYMTEANPEFKQAQQELGALRAELGKAEQIDKGKATGKGAEYVAHFRDFKYYETLFELMAKQYEMARLDEAREGAVIQVVDSAVVPERKSKPHRALITFVSTLIAFGLAVLIAFVRQALRNAKNEPTFAEKVSRLRHLLSRVKAGS